MSLTKVNYIDNSTVITAQNLNDIQDNIIQNAQNLKDIQDNVVQNAQLVKKVAPRNLLDNSDFRNPVNQRGETSYSGSTYNIDRWRTFHNNNVITVDNGCIRQTDTQLLQILDTNVIDKAKTYTLAACKVDGTIRIISGTFANQFSNAYLSCYIDTNIGYPCCVLLESDSYKWAALYEGEYTIDTLPEYQPKGYGAELAECRRYFQILNHVKLIGVLYTPNGDTRLNIPFLVPMRTIPTVLFNETVHVLAVGANGDYVNFEIQISSLDVRGDRVCNMQISNHANLQHLGEIVTIGSSTVTIVASADL